MVSCPNITSNALLQEREKGQMTLYTKHQIPNSATTQTTLENANSTQAGNLRLERKQNHPKPKKHNTKQQFSLIFLVIRNMLVCCSCSAGPLNHKNNTLLDPCVQAPI